MQKKLNFNKKKKPETVEVNNNTISTKLNETQLKLFKTKALEKNLTTSELLRQLIINYLDSEVTHENILQSQLVKVMDKIEYIDAKQEFFQQLFYAWLANWFLTHPAMEEKDQKIIWKNSVARRNEFMDKFIANIFNEDEELYEHLFANKVEDETDD